MAFHISRISMHNVRSFGDPDLDLTIGSGEAEFYTPRLHTVLIGENGTGKTTLLRAIAVGLADEKDASGLLAEPTGQFVAEGASEATVEIELQESGGQKKYTLATVIKSENGQDVLKTKDPKTLSAVQLVCGYGIGRGNADGSDTGRPYRLIDSVYTLFHYAESLNSTELGLRRLADFLKSGWYPRVMENIKKALGLDSAVTITLTKGGGIRVSGPGIGDIPFEGWADGYTKTLAWILDIYVWAMRAECITPTGDVTGIVLLDEIEQHLHPSMEIGLPSRLKELLPHVQIIATTHSPFVALGVEPEELVVLKRQGDKVQAYESVRDFHGYSVEDMVADPKIFDAPIYPPEMTKKLQRYRELASKPPAERSSEEKRKLQSLGSELAADQIPEVRGIPVLRELQAIFRKHNL